MRSFKRVVFVIVVTVSLLLATAYRLATRTRPAQKPRIANYVLTQMSMEAIRDREAAERLLRPVEKQDKTVVIGKLSTEDTSWVESKLPEWHSAIYTVDDTKAPLHTVQNKGRECLPYLTYLVDNYHNLSSVIAFVHAHEEGFPKAWHTDSFQHSNVRALRDLQTDFVLQNGYANLRCTADPGCPRWMNPHRGAAEPIGEKEMPEVWPLLFGADAVLPQTLATPCCAQFAVSREQVLKRPREDYVRWREWVLTTELADEVVGRIWEYLWHVAFGMTAVYCPAFKTCQCDVYGRYCRR